MFIKMRVLIRIIVVFVCAYLIAVREVRGEDVEPSEETGESEAGRGEDQRKDGKSGALSGGGRRLVVQQNNSNATRDSQLLTLLAARRRQLLSGRLATHISNLASLVHKPHKSNTTFAQLEIRDTNSSTLKRITFDNSSNEAAPTLKLVSHDGTKEIKQDIKPHEIRTHLFIPKLYQDNRSRTGFINIRRKDALNRNHNVTEITTEQGVVYVPPEKLEGLDKEVILDPEEEFQVDESNHGLYLLNFSDTENITQGQDLNKTINIGKENITKVEIITFAPNTTIVKDTTTSKPDENHHNNKTEMNIANSTDIKLNEAVGLQADKDKENNTLFMSDEIYNHFRPLETELPEEDMAPFHVFGKKLDVQAISDNLTNSPSLSASTKSVNFIAAPPEKRKFNSRYSATEKYRNTSVDEEELNEDMDVSVVKNIIEKNKIRNTVKGPAPGRQGLVNAYRKHVSSSTTTHKPLNIAQLNVTEPIVQNITPSSLNTSADGNRTNNVNMHKELTKSNSTNNSKEVISNRTNTTLPPRNYTRNYFNLRRRPSRVTALPGSVTAEIILPAVNLINTNTEKASTSVYTAVVTSVSITSSMKGQNKTDDLINSDNTTVLDIPGEIINNITTNPTLVNFTETTSSPSTLASSTYRSYRHKIRIRTTTPESSLKTSSPPIVFVHKSTESPIFRDLSTKHSAELQNEATTSRISERLANLFRQNSHDDQLNSTNGTIRPKSLRRRRPTTTTTTSTPRISPLNSEIPSTTALLTTPVALTTHFKTNKYPDTTENTFIPYIVTSKTSSESSSKPFILPNNKSTQSDLVKTVNNTEDGERENPVQNEEVVIEADKNYTASYILAGLGFLPVMAIIAFLLRNILNKKTKEIDTEYEGYFEEGDVKKESPITPVARPPMPTPSKLDQKWEFPRNKLRLQTLLGQGNFGQVWKAEADDLNGHDGLTRLVAVKSIKETASQKEKQELLHEIYIMQKIGTHPNVVTLLACCTEQEPYLLIMEYVMCGKLLTYLRERRSRPDRFSGSGALTSKDLTVFAYCVARGMDYIASKGIVHRDMAARNVLVDHNKLCKIADFGMSRAAGGASRNRGALPVRWMAPEALLYNVYSHETDVWAFGILLWEIVTLGSTPYAAMSGREVLAAVTEGYRLERPPHCKPQLYRAMHSCWHADPAQRPSFATLKSQLAELLDNEPSEGNYVDLDSFYQDSSVYSDPSAIIHDDDGLSAEYDRERSSFRELAKDSAKYDKRAFSFRDEELRNKFSIGSARMGGFGIRDVPFNERNFSDGEFNDRTFDKNFNDTNFTERKDGKLSTSSFHRERNERERENPIVSRNSFNGFPRIGTRENHFQMLQDGRNKRVSEFECDI